MDDSIQLRIREVMSFFRYNQTEFAHETGVRQNNLSEMLSGKRPISGNFLLKLSSRFGINPKWILSGEGEMSYMDEMTKNVPPSPAPPIEYIKELETRPRIPYTASAGSLTSAVEGVTESECEQIPVITAFPSYDFTMFVKGDSMYPNYEGGDEVACKRIDSTSFIQWGKVHVLDTAQGIVIKRVYDDDGNIRCSSYNKEYPDFTISKEEVYSMSLVVGMIRL